VCGRGSGLLNFKSIFGSLVVNQNSRKKCRLLLKFKLLSLKSSSMPLARLRLRLRGSRRR
jgi:hypothetical protein